MEFHLQFKRLRKSLKINQTKFGEIIGKSQGDVSELENAKQQPTKTLMAYLKYRYGDVSTWGNQTAQVPHTSGPSILYQTKDRRREERRKSTIDQLKTEHGLIVRCILNDVYELKKRVAELEKENNNLKAQLDEHQKAAGHFGASK